MVWTTPQTRMCAGDQIGNPWIREPVKAFDPYDYRILINTETARRKGLKDGDEVKVEAFWGGSTEGVVKVTELIHPRRSVSPAITASRAASATRSRGKGPDFNDLLSDREGEFDPISCATDISPAGARSPDGERTREQGGAR